MASLVPGKAVRLCQTREGGAVGLDAESLSGSARRTTNPAPTRRRARRRLSRSWRAAACNLIVWARGAVWSLGPLEVACPNAGERARGWCVCASGCPRPLFALTAHEACEGEPFGGRASDMAGRAANQAALAPVACRASLQHPWRVCGLGGYCIVGTCSPQRTLVRPLSLAAIYNAVHTRSGPLRFRPASLCPSVHPGHLATAALPDAPASKKASVLRVGWCA